MFKAPATGAVFALEVPYRDNLARDSLLPSLVAAASGYLTFVAFAGTEPLLPVRGVGGFTLIDLVGAAAVGVLGGLGARGFATLTRLAKDVQHRVNPALGAIAGAALLAILFRAGHAATGEAVTIGPGYEVIRWALQPELALWVIALMLVLRCLATLTAVGAGAAGGLFIPLVVAGLARTPGRRRAGSARHLAVRDRRHLSLPRGRVPRAVGSGDVRGRDDRPALLRRAGAHRRSGGRVGGG